MKYKTPNGHYKSSIKMGGRHSTEVAFTLLTPPARFQFSAQEQILADGFHLFSRAYNDLVGTIARWLEGSLLTPAISGSNSGITHVEKR